MAIKYFLSAPVTAVAVVIVGLFFLTVCSSNPAANNFEFFDFYINDEFVKNTLSQNFPLDFKIEDVDNARSYSYTLRFIKTNKYQYYGFGVVVAKAGIFLDAEKYNIEFKKIFQQNPAKVETEFPHIGKHAEMEPGFFGPGGSSFSLVFTTSDGKYDVRLVISMLLPNKVDSPDIDLKHAARIISVAYDKYTQ